jgi:hypothetical protein
MMRRFEAIFGSTAWALSSMFGWSPADNGFRGVHLKDDSSADYFSLLQSALPQLATAPGFSQIQPLICLTKNTSSVPILAYGVRWRIVSQSGKVLNYQRQIVIRAEGRYLHTAQLPILYPGEIHAVTPFATWSSSVTAENSATNGLAIDLSPYLNAPSIVATRGAISIEPLLDSAIDKTRVIEGPDTLKLAQLVTIERNAQHDEGLSVLNSLKANDDETTLLRKINYHISQAALPQNDTRRIQHWAARAACAKLLLQIYKRSGRKGLAAYAHRLHKISRTTIVHNQTQL